MRSGAGIAYPMGTETGRPFADIMSEDIGNAFGKKGNQVAVVNTQPTDKDTLILEQLRKTNSNRLILINCNEFYTDGYGTISLMYNLKLNIYSEKGELLLEKGFRKLIEEIFSDAEITPLLQH